MGEIMRLVITGSRTWVKPGPIKALILGFKALYPDLHVILGDAPSGVDVIAAQVCKDFGISHYIHKAQWGVHQNCRCLEGMPTCKAAGMRRNAEMVKDDPDVAYAFRADGPSPGTDGCVKLCLSARLPTYTVRENGQFP